MVAEIVVAGIVVGDGEVVDGAMAAVLLVGAVAVDDGVAPAPEPVGAITPAPIAPMSTAASVTAQRAPRVDLRGSCCILAVTCLVVDASATAESRRYVAMSFVT